MKKLLFISMLVALAGTLSAQNTADDFAQTDAAIKTLATRLAQKLSAERVETVTLGQFAHMGGANAFGAYLYNQLMGELTDSRGRSFTMVTGGVAPWTITGEIVPIGRQIRIYSRLVRREDFAVVAQIHSDMDVNQSIAGMLSFGGDGGGMVIADSWEIDGMDTPVMYNLEAGAGETMNRTIQNDDEDWFLITATGGSFLVMETTGDMDTCMHLYDADTREELATDDDGGDGNNALIRQMFRAGKRYLVKVRGYSDDTTGEYGFRAYTEDMGEAIPYQIGGDINSSQFTMRTLSGDANDLFLLTAPASGTLVMETSGNIDTVMELYEADTYTGLATDDDSGYDSNARIAHEVEAGKSYLARVSAFSSESGGRYGFKAYMD